MYNEYLTNPYFDASQYEIVVRAAFRLPTCTELGQTPESLADAIERFESCESDFDPAAARAWALTFDRAVFKDSIARLIAQVLG